MTSARIERLLRKADECELRAEMAADKAMQAGYYDLARQWRALATQVRLFETKAAERAAR